MVYSNSEPACGNHMSFWVFKARKNLWYFTKGRPEEAEPYWTWTVTQGNIVLMDEEGAIGISRGSTKGLHLSFRRVAGTCVAT